MSASRMTTLWTRQQVALERVIDALFADDGFLSAFSQACASRLQCRVRT